MPQYDDERTSTYEGTGLAIVPSSILPVEVLEGDWADVGKMPVVYSPSTESGKVNWEYLRTVPRGLKIVRTRMGRGGPVKYTGWTNTMDLFDAVWGPGQYGLELVQLIEKTRPDPAPETNKSKTVIPVEQQNVTEYIAVCNFWAVGLPNKWPVIGHGFYYNKDSSASHADAIESAMSRAMSKAGARFARPLRSVWAKDDEALKEMEPATEVQIMSVKLIYETLQEDKKKTTKANKYLKEKSIKVVEGEIMGLGELSKTEITEISKGLSDISMEDED